jgi:hypothetical protein
MEQRTTIQIERKTLKKLRQLRITKLETYDEILNRLIEGNGSEGRGRKKSKTVFV